MGSIVYTVNVCFNIKYRHKSDNKKMENTIVKAENYNSYFGDNHVVKDVNISINKNEVIAVMGPSGCGKTTFLRGINRMHELIPNATSKGILKLDGEDVYKMNAIYIRSKIGMVF